MQGTLPDRCFILSRGNMEAILTHRESNALLVFSSQDAIQKYLGDECMSKNINILQLNAAEIQSLVAGEMTHYVLDLKRDQDDLEVVPLPKPN